MYSVKINNSGGYSFDVESGGYRFLIDPKGAGVTPSATLLASLGSCIGVYIRKYAEGAKLDLKEFNITVEAAFTQEKPFRFQEISLIIDLKGYHIDERRQKSLMQFIKNCPIHNTLKASPSFDIKLI